MLSIDNAATNAEGSRWSQFRQLDVDDGDGWTGSPIIRPNLKQNPERMCGSPRPEGCILDVCSEGEHHQTIVQERNVEQIEEVEQRCAGEPARLSKWAVRKG